MFPGTGRGVRRTHTPTTEPNTFWQTENGRNWRVACSPDALVDPQGCLRCAPPLAMLHQTSAMETDSSCRTQEGEEVDDLCNSVLLISGSTETPRTTDRDRSWRKWQQNFFYAHRTLVGDAAGRIRLHRVIMGRKRTVCAGGGDGGRGVVLHSTQATDTKLCAQLHREHKKKGIHFQVTDGETSASEEEQITSSGS